MLERHFLYENKTYLPNILLKKKPANGISTITPSYTAFARNLRNINRKFSKGKPYFPSIWNNSVWSELTRWDFGFGYNIWSGVVTNKPERFGSNPWLRKFVTNSLKRPPYKRLSLRNTVHYNANTWSIPSSNTPEAFINKILTLWLFIVVPEHILRALNPKNRFST